MRFRIYGSTGPYIRVFTFGCHGGGAGCEGEECLSGDIGPYRGRERLMQKKGLESRSVYTDPYIRIRIYEDPYRCVRVA